LEQRGRDYKKTKPADYQYVKAPTVKNVRNYERKNGDSLPVDSGLILKKCVKKPRN